jgi:hypothetical protein
MMMLFIQDANNKDTAISISFARTGRRLHSGADSTATDSKYGFGSGQNTHLVSLTDKFTIRASSFSKYGKAKKME